MDSQSKRTLLATVLMVGVVLVFFKIQAVLNPIPQTPPASQPASMTAAGPTSQPGGGAAISAGPAASASAPSTPSSSGDAASAALVAVNAGSAEAITLGDDRQNIKSTGFKNPYEFAVTVSPRGAAVERVSLSRHRNHVARDKRNPDHDPFRLLGPVKDNVRGRDWLSFASQSVKVDGQDVRLDDVIWSMREASDASGQAVVLEAMLRRAGENVLRLRKTYRLAPGNPHIGLSIAVENLSGQPHSVILTETGPCGMAKDDPRIEYRRVVTAVVDDDKRISLGDHPLRADVHKLPDREMILRQKEGQHTLWAALSDKYFTSILAPRLPAGQAEPYARALAQVVAQSPLPENEGDDLTFRYVLNTNQPLPPGQTTTFDFDIYCGPKSKPYMATLAENAGRDYYAVLSRPDVSMCTFDLIGKAMLWLITFIHGVVGNYGVAIICLLIVVKSILHPLSKKGQLIVQQTQRGMARIKPKLDALQEQYKNDKMKLQEETLKLYRTENVSTTGPIFGCLPMFIQMPIWVALWSMLNTNVDMRHQPFLWWIRDLTSPDALISLPDSWHFHVPLLGAMMGGPIAALNILPILTVVAMVAQQKISQKLTAPAQKPPPKLDAEGRPIPDPMEQQQKMMPYMFAFMGFMFYNMPSGLSVYMLSNSLLGMVEQYQIRRVLRRMEERGQLPPAGGAGGSPSASPASDKAPTNGSSPTPSSGPKLPGWLERLQKKAEEARLAQNKQERAPRNKPRKKSRF